MRNETKRPRWRTNLLLTILAVGLVVSLATAWTTQNYLWRLPVSHSQSPPRALLSDPLALNYPDPSFVTNLTSALVGAGYQVDYWGPSSSSVEQFRHLPADSYDLMVIRSHTGSSQSIITTEPYSRNSYSTDQLNGALVPAVAGNSPVYFAMTPQFVRLDMMGRFPQSTVIIMGCSALQGSQDLATAFLDKGASLFVGWDSSVTIIHTDTSMVALARQLAQGRSIPVAVKTAVTEDPVYGARLQYLDWNTLVQGRINSLVSNAMIWIALAAVLVLGPTTVFVGPRLFDMIGHARERTQRRRKKATQSVTARSE